MTSHVLWEQAMEVIAKARTLSERVGTIQRGDRAVHLIVPDHTTTRLVHHTLLELLEAVKLYETLRAREAPWTRPMHHPADGEYG